MTRKHSKPPALRVHLFGYIFETNLVPLFALLLILPLLIALGCWQLDRAAQKKAIQLAFQKGTSESALTVADLSHITSKSRYRMLSLSGQFDNSHQFLIDNKMYHHQVGYHVITPFKLDDGHTVLINRGWIPNLNRQQLPALTPLSGKQHLHGFIDFPAKPFLLSHKLEMRNQWPLRLEGLEMPLLSKLLNKPVLPFVVLLSALEENGFKREWQLITMPYQRHLAYAFQWFSLAVTLIIIFIVINTHKRDK